MHAVRRRVPPVAVLRLVQLRLARIAAELAYLAEHAPHDVDLVARGRDLTRQARALRRFAEVIVAESRAVPQELGPESEVGRRVLAMLLARVGAIADEVLEPSAAAELRRRLSDAVAADAQIPWP